MSKSIDPHRVAVTVADALGASHFLIANILLLLGEKTDLFRFVGKSNPGFYFVMENLDAPIYIPLRMIFDVRDDFVRNFIFAELVFVAASALYGLICYWAVRFYISFFVVR